ncbi:MAG: alpha/beta hydrolase [Verrucomicrobiales bacterium]|nr:alpha/beta hydrolase [Verrucomicrobiales bacterium]
MVNSELEWVEHGGHRIACLSHLNPEANRLPVVWIHGLTMSVHFWEAGMFDLATEGRSWYSVSLPLHAPSACEENADRCAVDEHLLASMLLEALKQLIPEGRCHLVGHSLGGFAAMNLAAKFPDRIASVTSVGGFMTGRARGLEGALQFLASGHFVRKALFYAGFWLLKRHVLILKAATFSYARDWRSLATFPALDETLALVFPDVKAHSIGAQRAFCRYLLEMDLFDEVCDIETPVLVVAGEKDPIIPYWHQVKCAAALPAGELLSIPEVGHLAFAEAPGRFVPELVEWLERHE